MVAEKIQVSDDVVNKKELAHCTWVAKDEVQTEKPTLADIVSSRTI